MYVAPIFKSPEEACLNMRAMTYPKSDDNTKLQLSHAHSIELQGSDFTSSQPVKRALEPPVVIKFRRGLETLSRPNVLLEIKFKSEKIISV